MKVITEALIRQEIKDSCPKMYYIPEGKILSPAAREYLNQQKIGIDVYKRQEYDKAKMNKQDLQTGAVIITGETARKENANDVLNALSHMAGDFVVATAGPDLESVLSAKGAGTDVMSKDDRNTICLLYTSIRRGIV